jgi:hypothetical protein
LESVQRKFTKTIDCLRSSSYKERLINLGLDSLQYRRVKFDLVFCFKLLHGLVDVNTNDFVVLSHNNNLRGNQYKLVKPIATSTRDANFFSNRIVNIWNSLPNSVVNADTVSCFCRRLNLTDIERFFKLEPRGSLSANSV